MNIVKHLKKLIIGTACFAVIIVGAGISGTQQSAYAATTTASASKTSAQKADSIVALAKQLKGKVKYKFGQNNPSKLIFDCSSFTKYVFGKQGVNLTWGSQAQSKQGKFVSKSNLKKGDLVFFSVSTPGKVNHVGIYIGNGQFIHNTIGSSFNGILISDLSKYSKRYITARRVL
ncbi:C40 family peptidase [Cohnella terricola]|uniref:NlpC/P60 family protein n=1 Tax=Cohnella terricola TaxID=1289167 RepID=A0A559JEC4_9BACL|nr:C40 family peptidase [Cohnella terricola]TVX98215.1 NlpC/P60 family protein [Cohnella terricola]